MNKNKPTGKLSKTGEEKSIPWVSTEGNYTLTQKHQETMKIYEAKQAKECEAEEAKEKEEIRLETLQT